MLYRNLIPTKLVQESPIQEQVIQTPAGPQVFNFCFENGTIKKRFLNESGSFRFPEALDLHFLIKSPGLIKKNRAPSIVDVDLKIASEKNGSESYLGELT